MSGPFAGGPAAQPGPGRYTARCKEEEVREAYLSDRETGLATALRDALKTLFSEPRLPDNPYYHLAATLTAHVDQSALWKIPAADLLSVYDIEGGLEPLYGDLQLCKISGFSHCCGLPHVLRVVSRDGASFLHDALLNGLPESLFHAAPLSSAAQGGAYWVQTLCSVQGASALWRPQLLEFPELEIRCDVVVRGEKLDEAVRQFLDLVVRDVRELHQIPVYFVGDIAILDGPAVLKDGYKEPFRQSYSLDSVLNPAGEFAQTAPRLVLGGKVIQVCLMLLIEGPSEPSLPSSRKLRYESARKTYFLHYYSNTEARPTLTQPMTHFGCNPYDALYGGYYLDVNAARQYCNMYIEPEQQPYHRENLYRQMTLLRASIESDLQHGNSLAAWRQLLLLVLLHDPTTVKLGMLEPESFPSLEDLCLKAPKVLGNDIGWLLSTVPNLLRINSSAANVLEGIVRELEAISTAAAKWPAKLKAVQQAAAAPRPGSAASVGNGAEAGTVTAETALDGVPRTSGTTDSRRTVRTPDVSRAMATWLSTFNLEGRLLGQLVGLREPILAAIGGRTGHGYFSGISRMIQRLVSELPTEVPAAGHAGLLWGGGGAGGGGRVSGGSGGTAAAAALAAAQPQVSLLCHLLHAAALSVSHGFVTRCVDVQWALMFLKIPVANLSDLSAMNRLAAGSSPGANAGGGSGAHAAAPPPAAWVLDVPMVRGALVRAGQLAERVSTEGVMLQYAVDCKLDEFLSTVWQLTSQPPLPLNPYPKLLDLLRSQAAKMELWHDDPDQALSSYLVNELTLVQPPSFIYAATLPPTAPAHPVAAGIAAAATAAAAAAAAARGEVLPPSSAVASGPAGAATAASGGGACEDSGGFEEDQLLFGYGSYAAVTCVDVRALQALRETLGPLLADRHWQAGAYQGEVVPSLVGDVAISNALRLDQDAADPGVASVVVGRGRRGAAPSTTAAASAASSGRHSPLVAPFDHPRLYGMESEEHHLVEGPRRREAARAFAREVVRDLLALHTASPHVVFSAGVVGGSTFFASDLWNRGGEEGAGGVGASEGGFAAGRAVSGGRGEGAGGGEAGGRGGGGGGDGDMASPGSGADVWTAGGGGGGEGAGAAVSAGGGASGYYDEEYGDYRTGRPAATGALPYSGLERFRNELLEAALRVPEGRLLASVVLYVAPAREMTYAPLTRHVIFQYRKVRPSLLPSGSVTAALPGAHRPSTAEQQAQLWATAVYQRVFLSEFDAMTWYGWNSERGDPAQPYHYRAMVAAIQEAAPRLEASGRILQLHRSLLQAAIALQDHSAVYQLSRVFGSAAQELKCLQEVHLALTDLMAPEHRTVLAAKLENERLRRLFMTYIQRVRAALTNPRYNYFTGLAAAVPAMLAELREEVLSTFCLNSRLQELMRQIAVWTHCCEVSVAEAVHAGLGELGELGRGLRAEGGGARTGVGSSGSGGGTSASAIQKVAAAAAVGFGNARSERDVSSQGPPPVVIRLYDD